MQFRCVLRGENLYRKIVGWVQYMNGVARAILGNAIVLVFPLRLANTAGWPNVMLVFSVAFCVCCFYCFCNCTINTIRPFLLDNCVEERQEAAAAVNKNRPLARAAG
ncbi:hypothetical protein BaRGS_00018947 [Batillaria attramentaria]|uniref:Solute carrier family 40 protein n=1 Tax=Batillaria attramentaria TaxID=370345 RepID=A0ABD0KR65_9CAEN